MSDIITKLERVKQTKTEIKQAIKSKGSACDTDCFKEYPGRILAIPSGGVEPSIGVVLQEKTLTTNGVHLPDEGYGGFSKVTVKVPSSGGYDNEIARLYTKGDYVPIYYGDLGEAGICTPIGIMGDSVAGFYTKIEN